MIKMPSAINIPYIKSINPLIVENNENNNNTNTNFIEMF